MKSAKPFRSRAALCAACLFVWAQSAGIAQSLGASGVQTGALMSETDAYLPAAAQLIAPANVKSVLLHPQGRYALITQEEAALPPGPLIGKSTTGAVSLLLYDGKLRKTRTLWERRADDKKHMVLEVLWIAQTNCALVQTFDSDLLENGISAGTSSLLFFNFDKSLAPRVLATSQKGFTLAASPTQPLFVVEEDDLIRMGSAPSSALGAPLTVPPATYLGYGWTKEGTSVYGTQRVTTPATPTTKETSVRKWFTWDGTKQVTFLANPPKDAGMAQEIVPVLPIALRRGTVLIPPAPQITPFNDDPFTDETPANAPIAPPNQAAKASPKDARKTAPPAAIHPLFLETANAPKPETASATPVAGDTKPAPTNAPNAVLLVPNADKSYLLADESAVLYETGRALYAVPLIKIKAKVYAEQVVKAAAMQNAKHVGLGILMYAQDYDEEFPLSDAFPTGVRPYLKNDSVFAGFSYQNPGVSMGKIAAPATTVMGYLATPNGRAVLFVDGHVIWEDKP